MAARLEAKAQLQEQAREAQAEAQRLNKQTHVGTQTRRVWVPTEVVSTGWAASSARAL